MLNVFVKKSAEELHVQLSDGRIVLLEDLVRDYERLLKETPSKEAIIPEPKDDKAIEPEPKDDKAITQELKVGEWFLIDRDAIDKSKEEIHRKCSEAGTEGNKLWERFEESNKIADENHDQYPNLIETYIFKHSWEYKTEQEMRDMCEDVGDGMCDEVICDLELQMRICNGESVDDLVKKADKLPRIRVIQLRNGGTGYFGGGVDNDNDKPPTDLAVYDFDPEYEDCDYTPYAFRRVLLKDLVSDYERPLKEKPSKEAIIPEPKDDKAITPESKDDKAITQELKVGEWFLIDRDAIDKSKEEIHRKCSEAGTEGNKLWERFEESNKIADENHDQYPNLIETYIFERSWEYKTEQEMRDMCEDVGDGMCDEVICDLELQMRICNGESVDDLVKKADKLPRIRVIQLRNGGTGYFGGGADRYFCPPADLSSCSFDTRRKDYSYTPYAFRRVLLKDLVRDYERPLKEKPSKEAIIPDPKDDKAITPEPKDDKAIEPEPKDDKAIEPEPKDDKAIIPVWWRR